MRIAVLSDAHGNRVYFDRVIDTIQELEVSKIYYLGDTFGYGLDPFYIMKNLQDRNAHCLLGNHDAMLLGYISIDEDKDKVYNIIRHKADLREKDKKYLSTLLPFHEEKIDNKQVLFVHGSPIDPLQGYLYENSVIDINNIEYDIIFMGHTHRPYVKKKGNTLYVNVGSCGLPRDIGNEPSFALYDFNTDECKIIRTRIELKDIERSCMNTHKAVKECLYRNIQIT